MNKQILLISAFFIFTSFATNTFTQEFDSTFTINQMRLPEKPGENAKNLYSSIEDEIANILLDEVRNLRLYDVIVGIEIDSDESFMTGQNIIDFRQISRFVEAIVISEVDFSQHGVPPVPEDDYFQIDGSVKDLFDQNGDEKYSNNVHTELHLNAWIVDIKTQQVVAPFTIDVFYTGGSRQKSRAKAMSQLKEKTIYQLKWFYWLATEITKSQDNIRELPIGTDMMIRKNELFEIIEPDRTIETADGELIILGGPVAIAAIADTAKNHSQLKIIRQWRDDYPGSWAVEHPRQFYALQFSYVPPVTDTYSQFAIQFNARPLRSLDWGFGAQFIKVVDSFDDNDYGFGFGGFGMYRFLNLARLDLGAKIGCDLDIPFRNDDDDQTVSAGLLSTHIGVVAEFLISAKVDLVLMAGYRFGLKSKEWSHSEDEESYDAYWENEAPEVDNTGFTISVGTIFLFK